MNSSIMCPDTEREASRQDLLDFIEMWKKCAHYWKRNYDDLKKEYHEYIAARDCYEEVSDE